MCVAKLHTRSVRTKKAASRRPSKGGRCPTLPGACAPSTIGAGGLNFSVRNGKRCIPAAMTAQVVEVPVPVCGSTHALKTP